MYEHLVVDLPELGKKDLEEFLNELSSEGWLLVCGITTSDNLPAAVFRREQRIQSTEYEKLQAKRRMAEIAAKKSAQRERQRAEAQQEE